MKKLFLALAMCAVLAATCSCGYLMLPIRPGGTLPDPSPTYGPEDSGTPYAYAEITQPNRLQNTDFPPHLISPPERETEPYRYMRDGAANYETREATYSDELFNVMERGYKPMCVPLSNADVLYREACKTLDSIILNDMTDFERVHAIYDWLVYCVQYDYALLERYENNPRDPSFEGDPAFDLRGVFCDREAVCDGISKAFTIMCLIENIECMQVVGYGVTGGKQIGHAWCKIYMHTPEYADCPNQQTCEVSGHRAWYIADPTWGNLSVGKSEGSVDEEILTHAFFLVSDSDASDHQERPREDENLDALSYPKAPNRYDYFAYEYVQAPGTTKISLKVTSESQLTNLVEYVDLSKVKGLELEMRYRTGGVLFPPDYRSILQSKFRSVNGKYLLQVTDNVFLLQF